MRTREEEQHNTPEQAREYLREALTILEEIESEEELDPRLRSAVFSAAVGLLAPKQIFWIEHQMGGVDLGNLNRRH